MRSYFDDELKNRLANYAKEPDEKLWKGITNHIPSTPKQSSAKWTDRIADTLTIIGLAAFLYLNLDFTQMQPPASSLTAVVESSLNQETIVEDSENEMQPIPASNIAYEKDIDPVKSAEHPKINKVREDDGGVETVYPQVIEIQPSTTVTSDDEFSEQSIPIEKSLVLNSEKNRVSQGSAVEKDPKINENKKEDKEEQKEKEEKQRKLDRSKQEHKHQKFDMYIIAMPTFGYQRIETNQNDNIIVESMGKISAFSTNRLGFRVEAGAETRISKRMKVFWGVLYYQRKQTIDYVEKQVDSLVVSAGPDGEVIVDPYFKNVNKSFEYELKNIGIQMGLNYRLSKKMFLQTIGTGLEFQFALNKSASNEGFTNNPTAYVFYNLYYRLQYPSEGRLKAVFQPTLNYSFYINQDLNAPFYVKPYGLGLNIGLTYNF